MTSPMTNAKTATAPGRSVAGLEASGVHLRRSRRGRRLERRWDKEHAIEDRMAAAEKRREAGMAPVRRPSSSRA